MAAEQRTLGLILVGLTLIAAVSFTAWFLTNFERRPQEVAVGATAAARRNPFLAAERFLARLGIPVESRAGRDLLRRPPATTDTLVVNGLGSLNPQHQTILRTWLQGGGRLLVEATQPWDHDGGPDDLVGGFGIGLEEAETATDGDPEQTLALVRWGDARTPLKVGFDPDWSLRVADPAAAAVLVQADGHTRLVKQAVGAGELIVTSDNQFFTNGRIGRHDHALFFAQLARPAPGGKVWLLYDSSVPWLGALLWAAAPGALGAGAVLVLTWVWFLGARLGPLTPAPDRRRRDLIEHLDAAAAFLWRHGRASHLVAATQRQVQGAWQRRCPALRHLSPGEQAAAIAKGSLQPAGPVATALHIQAPDVPGLIDQTRLLKALWQGTRPPGTVGGDHGRGPRADARPAPHDPTRTLKERR